MCAQGQGLPLGAEAARRYAYRRRRRMQGGRGRSLDRVGCKCRRGGVLGVLCWVWCVYFGVWGVGAGGGSAGCRSKESEKGGSGRGGTPGQCAGRGAGRWRAMGARGKYYWMQAGRSNCGVVPGAQEEERGGGCGTAAREAQLEREGRSRMEETRGGGAARLAGRARRAPCLAFGAEHARGTGIRRGQ